MMIRQRCHKGMEVAGKEALSRALMEGLDSLRVTGELQRLGNRQDVNEE
jgi:hypothetical protein